MTPPAVVDEAWRRPSRLTRVIPLGLVLAALAIVGLAGGLRRAPGPAPALPVVAVETTVDSGLWTAAVVGATGANGLGVYVPHQDAWLLAVVIRVAVAGPDGQSAATLDRIATLPEQSGLTEPTPRWVTLRRDASELGELNPGMPELVSYIFEIADSTLVPASVTVQLSGYLPQFDFQTRRLRWTDFGPRARVTVPVKDSR